MYNKTYYCFKSKKILTYKCFSIVKVYFRSERYIGTELQIFEALAEFAFLLNPYIAFIVKSSQNNSDI